MFPAIDKDPDGKVSSDEYKEFQAFKAKNKDWKERLRSK